MRKEDLKSRIFCPKISQLCCVMVTKHIFSVLYIHFISYFYMVIIHLYVVSGPAEARERWGGLEM